MIHTIPKEIPQNANAGKKEKGLEFVSFQFLKIDPRFRTLLSNEKHVAKEEFLTATEPWYHKIKTTAYFLMGLRADCDIMFWRVDSCLENLQESSTVMFHAGLGKYLLPVYSYLGVSRTSPGARAPEGHAPETAPERKRYLFVCPFAKSKSWYELPPDVRQNLADEFLSIANNRPNSKVHAFSIQGLDDQEFVAALETGWPDDFLDVMKEIKKSKCGEHMAQNLNIFPCVLRDVRDILDSLR